MATIAAPSREEVRSRLAAVRRLVGHTPLLAVRCRFRGNEYTIYAKHEVTNFTGSIKDRMAFAHSR